ncbi:F0F1 ATP synthase subunit B [Hoeflea sp. TYP-13]|uniref:F0F1 ATP synthase subunit B n=1 Tax=Hoeflea sp. TYP-13 TaxID=3230023 RepID=UPI0034C5FB41
MLVTAAYAATAETAEHAAEGNFPPFDSSTFASQILWLVITFGFFYLFMSRVVLPRIGSILETRRDRIAQDLNEANRLKEEADQAFATYEQELADAKSKAHEIAQAARDAAKADADAERAKVEAEVAGKLEKAEAEIAAVKTKALAEVGTIAADTTAAIVKQLIGGTVTKAKLTAAVKAAAEGRE